MRNIFNDNSRITGRAIYFQSGISSSVCRKAAEKFIRSAYVLPEESCLGLQIRTESSGKHSASVFSCPDESVTVRDYDWIFRRCAAALGSEPEEISSIFREDRKVYRILSDLDARPENVPIRNSYYFDDYDDGYRDHFREMFSMLCEEGAVITVTAGTAESAGMILISLPEAVTLRMRSSAAMAVPCTVLEEIYPGHDPDASGGKITERSLQDFLENLFCMLTQEQRTEQQDYEDIIPDELPETDDEASEASDTFSPDLDTPIEKLELSLRAYNCLRRAGIDTVEKLRTLSDYDLKQIRNLGRKSIEEIRQKLQEIPCPYAGAPSEKTDHMSMLENLIGLQDVKQQIRKITAFAKLRREMIDSGKKSPSAALNMEFVGNPGTAKTTVARITAGILHDAGLITDDRIIEVGRADLIARYEGQTAAKVRGVFQRAKGRVLFIDEAYSLLEQHRGEYGDEAISTIVQEMENCRDDTVVIFAGYPDEMDEFFARNPGLRSRVPFRLQFSDYSSDELARIAELVAAERGFGIDPEASGKLMDICAEVAFRPELGNGRFCRNLIENAVLNYALRIYGEGENGPANDYLLRKEDFISPAKGSVSEFSIIGFAA